METSAVPVRFIAAAALALLAGCERSPPSGGAVAPIEPGPAPAVTIARPTDLRANADAVLAAFEARDGAGLQALAAPEGVRFSPAAYVDPATDQLLSPAELAAMFSDPKVRQWGYAEASGDPIALTGSAYASRYVPAADARRAATVTLDGSAWAGNSVDNIAQAYPGARTVEYLIEPPPGTADPEFARRALRLVFRPVGDGYRLAAVVHVAWSP
jgi:hypothetical protein